MHKENVSLQAAWRILRGLSQQEVAAKLGISQSAVSQLEALDSRPQKRTREKLAAIYGCTVSKSASICRKRVNSTSPRPCRRSARPAFAKELFISHRRLIRVGYSHVLDVVIVIRHADHHLRRLARYLPALERVSNISHFSFVSLTPSLSQREREDRKCRPGKAKPPPGTPVNAPLSPGSQSRPVFRHWLIRRLFRRRFILFQRRQRGFNREQRQHHHHNHKEDGQPGIETVVKHQLRQL